jgi:hypothetical protein
LPVIFVIVAVFFVASLGVMVRAEMKTLERRDVNLFNHSPKKRRGRTLNGVHIIE